MSRESRRVTLGLLSLVALGVFVAARVEVTTDVLHFLPRGEARDDVTLARAITGSELTRTSILLVEVGGEPDPERAAGASRILEEELRREPRVAAELAFLEGGAPKGTEEALWTLYHPRRLSFVARDAEAVRAATTPDALAKAAAHLRRQLGLPLSSLVSRLAPSDPLLVLRDLFDALAASRAEGIGLEDGRFVTLDGRHAVLFVGSRSASFDARTQGPFVAGIEAAFQAAKRRFEGDLALRWTGASRFAVRAEETIRADVRRVSAWSIGGIVLLFLLLFRSLRPAALTLLVVSTGFLVASAGSLLLFGRLHGVTLAFGAALIGVGMDYTIHFVCHHALAPAAGGPRRTLTAIAPGLVLGAATTATGFASLAVSSFPGLRELAVFAALGIAGALAAALVFLPGLVAPSAPATRLGEVAASALERARRRLSGRPLPAVLAVAAVLALAGAGLPRATWNDDIADLNRLDPDLVAEDAAVRSAVVRYEPSLLVVATGEDDEEALQANDRVAEALERAEEEGELEGHRGVAALLPSVARQREVDRAVREDAELLSRLERALAAEGFQVAAFEPFAQALASPPPEPLRFEDLLASPLAPLVRPFRLTLTPDSPDERVGVATFLAGVRDREALARRIEEVEGARLIDVRAVMERAYGAYRGRMTTLLLVGLAAVLVLVVARYRDRRRTLLAAAPALLSAAGTVGLLGLIGVPLNLLALVALLMVVSMGVDYGVFLAEARGATHVRATGLAIVVAGASTVLGFGLLALSDHPALFSIGVTAGAGVSLCLFLALILGAVLFVPPEEPT